MNPKRNINMKNLANYNAKHWKGQKYFELLYYFIVFSILYQNEKLLEFYFNVARKPTSNSILCNLYGMKLQRRAI